MVFSFLLIAVAVCGFSVYAHATTNELSGNALLYTYYDIRSEAAGGIGLTDNYFTATNISTNAWLQAHVRVRTGHHSLELLDFDILLSPSDVFTFDLYEDNGVTVFASCDPQTLVSSGFTPNFDKDGNGTNECFVLDTTTFPAMLSLILECDPDVDTIEEALAHTKKGYVEIIGEGIIRSNTAFGGSAKALCPGINGVPNEATLLDDVTIAGKLLDHTVTSARLCSSSNGIGLCPSACAPVTEELVGRVYYGTVAAGLIATRLGQLNAEILDNGTEIILHKESYQAELTDADCSDADASDGCYAYREAVATTVAVANGADDMNFCLYNDSIATVNGIAGVRNKFGAAATYGPTMADLVTLRDGSLATTAGSLNVLSSNLSTGFITGDGRPMFFAPKTFPVSHYFSVPAPGPFDMRTAFAFIFPLQHFIAESDFISVNSIFDTEENRTIIQLDKFLSPGLPTLTSPGEEAALFSLTAPFVEGWIKFAPSATNATSTTECDPGSSPCVSGTNILVRTGATSYLPGYTSAVFTIGGSAIDVSPFQFEN
jgi:hypothetical protein